MDNLRLRSHIATVLLLIAGVWTVGARAQNAAQDRGWVRISAFTNTPVADADVVVSRVDGEVLFEKDNATNARGFFAADVDPMPKNFRVTLIWEAKAPYQSLGLVRMSTDVRHYDPAHGVVFVNPVTTMVSRLLDRRPELGLRRARAIVRRVLGMPANTSLGAAMREGPYYQSPVFSETEFLKQANKYGSFDGYLESLVTEAIYDPNKRHLFRPPQNLLGSTGIGTDAAKFVATGLASGALSYLGGQGVGWAATAAGLFSPGATKADIDQLSQKLDDLQSSVDALSNQLAQSTAQILAAINYSQYNLIATQQLKLAAQVDVVEQDVAVLADGCPALTTQPAPPLSRFCKSQKALVASELSESEIHASFEEFAVALEDSASAGSKGMLHLFSLCTGETVGHFFRYGDSIKIQDMASYWNAVEVQAANLKVELLHLQDAQDNSAGKKELLNFLGDVNAAPPTDGELQNTQNAEAALVFPVLPQGEVVNTADKFIWMTTFPGSTSLPSCKYGLNNPPNGQGGASPGPELGSKGNGVPITPYPGDPETNWYSPYSEQLSSLIKDFAYKPVGTWLQIETSTKAGDPPGIQSIGFADVSPVTSACTTGPWVWTKTLVNPNTAGNYVVFNFGDGSTQPTNSSVGKQGNYNWVFLVSQFQYQYYWYN